MLKLLLKIVFLKLYNIVHKTNIKSVQASIKANYGVNVLIDLGTVVEQNVTIGDYSYVNKNSSVENCSIGKYCSISSGVYICPFEHNLDSVSTHPFFYIKERAKENRRPVTIGNDVLISLNAIVLEGVTIGDGAVIAAGAVVTKDVKPYEIVGGVPAKHIRFRFSGEMIEKLLKIQWWNWEHKAIERNKAFFIDVNNFEVNCAKKGF